MNAVITLGIDMSSQPNGTAACAVTWEADRAVTVTPCLGCDDEMLSEMIAKSDAVGIVTRRIEPEPLGSHPD